jgi:hypothetical protein
MSPTSGLPDLIASFAATNALARAWIDSSFGNMPDSEADCNLVSEAFIVHAAAHGVTARLVHVRPPTIDPWYSDHWFVEINGTGIDWSARQFYNVNEDEEAWLDPTEIPVPLLFPWPGEYPLDIVQFTEVTNARSTS